MSKGKTRSHSVFFFQVKLHFSDMYLNVRSPEECFHNALSIIHALRSLGIDYDIHPTDIMQPNAINMLLFITHLYITLPQYKLVLRFCPQHTLTNGACMTHACPIVTVLPL